MTIRALHRARAEHLQGLLADTRWQVRQSKGILLNAGEGFYLESSSAASPAQEQLEAVVDYAARTIDIFDSTYRDADLDAPILAVSYGRGEEPLSVLAAAVKQIPAPTAGGYRPASSRPHTVTAAVALPATSSRGVVL